MSNKTKGTDEIIQCPHCGNNIVNLYELGEMKKDMVIQCDHCEGLCSVEEAREIVQITLVPYDDEV